MPGWKNDLKHNTAYASTLQAVAALQNALMSLESKPDLTLETSSSPHAPGLHTHDVCQTDGGELALWVAGMVVLRERARDIVETFAQV